jgi:hypothetical protein
VHKPFYPYYKRDIISGEAVKSYADYKYSPKDREELDLPELDLPELDLPEEDRSQRSQR